MTKDNDKGRFAHLVGSIPASDGAAAMKLAKDELGSHLRWLPDGETGDRQDWVASIIDGLRTHPDLELSKEGDWSDYDSTPRFRIRKGHKLVGSSLDFGHVEAFEESYPLFKKAKAKSKNDDLTFQVGIPGDFDMAGLVLGPGGALRKRSIFHDATVSEIRRIAELADDDVLFQIEVPFELIFVARAPKPIRRLVAKRMAKIVAKIGSDAPAGTRFGIHLCLGDMNHESLINMKDMSPVVALANAIVAVWPQGRPLEFVHAPFAGASQAPSLEESYYAPLSKLRLGGARFIAGFAYEHQDLEQQQRLLGVIEREVGRKVDVSAACGLGRRSPEEARASMARTRQLVET